MPRVPLLASGRRRRRLSLAVAAVAALAIAVLVARGVSSTPRGLTWQSLLNATYPTSLSRTPVRVSKGSYEAPAAPGSASKISVRLAGIAAFGDLDGDGVPDAATVLVSSGGGTGAFIELTAVLNDHGKAKPVATALLGDRVLVRAVDISAGRMHVRFRTRGAADALTDTTVETSREYALQNGKLVLLNESQSQAALNNPAVFEYREQAVSLAVGGSQTIKGTLTPGSIATYVVHGKAGEELDLAIQSNFDDAVLSISGLTDGNTLLSRGAYAVRGAVVLPLDQDYAIRVICLSGQSLPFQLELALRTGGRVHPSPTLAPPPVVRPPQGSGSSSALRQKSLAELSTAAAQFGQQRPPIWGAAVAVPNEGVIYTANADEPVPTASVVKVLVMLVVLDQARQDGRPVSDDELALLWPMITQSDNDAATELWNRVGGGPAVAGYVRTLGIGGFTADPEDHWGLSFVTARTMALVLAKLISGEILDAASRAVAMRLMESVIPAQRWGVTAGTTGQGDAHVAVKNGWYPGNEGWRVNSVGIIVPRSGPTYSIAVVTDDRASWQEGIDTIEGIASPLNSAFEHRQA